MMIQGFLDVRIIASSHALLFRSIYLIEASDIGKGTTLRLVCGCSQTQAHLQRRQIPMEVLYEIQKNGFYSRTVSHKFGVPNT
jgi:hypothetical protein